MGNTTHLGTEFSANSHIPLILIADDDPATRLLLRHTMEQESYHVLEVANGLEAVEMAKQHQPDLVLMDAVMPEMDGFQATAELLKTEKCIDIPILIITALDDDKSISHAFSMGACDYITKPINWSVLKNRVARLLQTVAAERKIRHLAYHDTLTGLPNRLLFSDRIDQAICRCQRSNTQFALFFIDLDRFKIINDSMGHEAGDALLKAVTERLKNSVRKSDTLARLGGDEFTLILENLQQADTVASKAQHLLDILSKPITIHGRDVCVEGSIGVSLYPDDGENFGDLLKNADTAMYEAKQSGRNTVRFYTQEMSSAALQRLEMENNLREAIKNQEFCLYYQPKYQLPTGECCGMEALVRWQHPSKGLIPPDSFIPLAEETGLVVKLGNWIIETACEQLKNWQQSGYAVDNLSINISARQFHESNLTTLFARIIDEKKINPANIEIELTESTLVQNQQNASEILSELHRMGFKIALDDFGTGYASMAYLKDFPIDTVKIDRSFVWGIPDSKQDMAIVKAINSLAEAMELTLIAEGVETKQQLAFLKQLGCAQGQGYLWSKPLPETDFEAQILKGHFGV